MTFGIIRARVLRRFAMFSSKRQLIIFRDDEARAFSVRPPAWIAPAFVAVCLGLVAADVFLARAWWRTRELRPQIVRLEASQRRHMDELLDLVGETLVLRRSLGRIADFDAKLRVMLAMETTPYLGPQPEEAEPEASLIALPPRDLIRALGRMLDDIHEEACLQETLQLELLAHLGERKDAFSGVPSIWPVRGRFSSPFGYRRNPFGGGRQFHKGIDITARTGTPVRAPASGVVTYADRFSTYGLTLDIRHDSGIETRYAHLSGFAVKEGEWVARGQIIGFVGNTGRSQAPHLHYEVRARGELANPLAYILD